MAIDSRRLWSRASRRRRSGSLSATSAGEAYFRRRFPPGSVANIGSSKSARSSSCSAIRKGISSQACGRTSQSSSSSSASHFTSAPAGPVARRGDCVLQIASLCRRAKVSSGMIRPSSSTGISRQAARPLESPGTGASAVANWAHRPASIRHRAVLSSQRRVVGIIIHLQCVLWAEPCVRSGLPSRCQESVAIHPNEAWCRVNRRNRPACRTS